MECIANWMLVLACCLLRTANSIVSPANNSARIKQHLDKQDRWHRDVRPPYACRLYAACGKYLK